MRLIDAVLCFEMCVFLLKKKKKNTRHIKASLQTTQSHHKTARLWNINEHISLSFPWPPNQLQHAWRASAHSSSSARFTGSLKRKPVQVKKSLNSRWNSWKCQEQDTTMHSLSTCTYASYLLNWWNKVITDTGHSLWYVSSMASLTNRGKVRHLHFTVKPEIFI